MSRLFALLGAVALLVLTAAVPAAASGHSESGRGRGHGRETVRFATFNASLNRTAEAS